MKNCPTSNMNRSQLWGFEVSHIVISFGVLATSNILLNIVGAPLFLSWLVGFFTLVILRVISHGQKNGHLELLARFILEPHIYLGHKECGLKGSQPKKRRVYEKVLVNKIDIGQSVFLSRYY